MAPVLQPFMGKSGTPKPTVLDREGGRGGALPSGQPQWAEVQLPAATRSGYQYEQWGTARHSNTSYGDETINPVVGGRMPLWTEYEDWGQPNGGFVTSGADMTINNPTEGMRVRNVDSVRYISSP